VLLKCFLWLLCVTKADKSRHKQFQSPHRKPEQDMTVMMMQHSDALVGKCEI